MDTHHHYTTTPSPSSPLLAGTHDGMPLLSGPAHPHSPVGGHYNAEHHHQQVGQVQTQMTGDNSPPYVFDGSNGRQQLPVHGTMRGMGMRGCVAAAQSGVSGPNVVPLPLLTRFAAAVECPACRAVGPTNVEHKVGKGAHGMAVLFFFTTGIFFFIPYVADHFKDVKHSCIRCGRGLATHHFGAGTEAHLM